MLYTLRFFSSKCSLFHNANLFGSRIIHILYTECAEIKKNSSGAKGLTCDFFVLTSVFLNRSTFLQCYETRPSAGRNNPLSELQRKFKRQRDEEVQYFNSYVINLDSTCRLNK